jgi:hypothetical protein
MSPVRSHYLNPTKQFNVQLNKDKSIKSVIRQKYARSLKELSNSNSLNLSSDQADNNLNSRLQFLERQMENKTLENFNRLWKQICTLHNRQNDVINSILKIDPTVGVRLWIKRDDISAKFVGEAIAIFECTKVTAQKIIWNHLVNGKCYSDTPVEVKLDEITHNYFIKPGTRDLVNTSKVIPCNSVPKNIFRHSQGNWSSGAGLVKVQLVPNIFTYDREHSNLIVKGKNVFQSDLSEILTSLKIVSNYANKINFIEKTLSNRTIIYNENSENIFSGLGEKFVENIENIKNSTNVLLNPLGSIKNLIDEWKVIFIGAGIIISIFLLIGSVIYFFPWLTPFFNDSVLKV